MKILVYLIMLFLILQLATAVTYEHEFNIKNNNVDILINIDFDYATNFNFNLNLPDDFNNVKVLLDNDEKIFLINNNIAVINGTAKNLKISYFSSEYLESAKKNYFTAEVTSLLDGELQIKVILPEGAVLDKPFKNNLEEASIYPEPDKIETNGKNLIITWNYDTNKNEDFPLFITYNEKKFNYIYLIISLIIIVFALFLFRRKKIIKIKTVKVDDVEKHLKEEEKIIIDILKQKQGSCTQATLVTLTNMSKASLSRILNELQARNIILKEKKGNKNLITLKRS